VDWSLDYLILPNICLYRINASTFEQLMNEKSSFIQLVNRKKIVDELIEMFKSRSIDSLYLYGPSGCGKSFIIYQIACQLMREDYTMVIYVNKASPDVIHDILRMLKTRYFSTLIITLSNAI
jgi:DNA replication protein DnaC